MWWRDKKFPLSLVFNRMPGWGRIPLYLKVYIQSLNPRKIRILNPIKSIPIYHRTENPFLLKPRNTKMVNIPFRYLTNQ